jgi:hypothetical protein
MIISPREVEVICFVENILKSIRFILLALSIFLIGYVNFQICKEFYKQDIKNQCLKEKCYNSNNNQLKEK